MGRLAPPVVLQCAARMRRFCGVPASPATPFVVAISAILYDITVVHITGMRRPMSSAHWLQKLGLERILVSNVSATAGGCSMSLRPSPALSNGRCASAPSTISVARRRQTLHTAVPAIAAITTPPESELSRLCERCRRSPEHAEPNYRLRPADEDRANRTLGPVRGSTIWAPLACAGTRRFILATFMARLHEKPWAPVLAAIATKPRLF